MEEQHNQPLEFAVAILRRGQDVLIVRPQSVEGVRSRWAFPGGRVQAEETPEDACNRICADRLGAAMDIQIRQPPLRSRQGEVRVLYHYFFGHLRDSDVENREFAETRWVRLGQLREYEFDDATQVVVDWLLRHG